MYFRTKKTKTTPVLQLVEGRRDRRGKVIQRVVASFGNLPVPSRERREIAQEIDGVLLFKC